MANVEIGGSERCAEFLSADTMGHSATHVEKHELVDAILPRIGSLRRYVTRKVPDRFRASVSPDDILQETWIAAFRSISTFVPDGPDALDRWLTKIATTKLIDAVRTARAVRNGGDRRFVRNAQHRMASFGDLFARIQSRQRTPSSEVGTSEAIPAASVSLHSLSKVRRRVIEMRFVGGLTREEIAREMGKSKPAVNGLLYHGLRELRAIMGSASKYFSDMDSFDEADTPD